MTNKEVSEIFTSIYNGFWMKYRDAVPELHDAEAWEQLYQESVEIQKKYNCQLASDMIAGLVAELDQRARRINHGEKEEG